MEDNLSVASSIFNPNKYKNIKKSNINKSVVVTKK